MGVERVDYYSDEEYEHALAFEAQEQPQPQPQPKRDNQEIHDAIVEGYCGDCKGEPSYCDLTLCDGYKEEYDEIEKEWGDE